MGLDAVELVLEVEDEFGIAIPDDVATSVATVGDLCDCVVERMAGAGGPPCRTSRSFYRFRAELTRLLGTDRARVRPDTALGEIIPPDRRRDTWCALTLAGLALPPLCRPWGLNALIVGVSIIAAGVLSQWVPSAVCIALAFPMVLIGYWLTQPQAIHIPSTCVTVGDAVLSVTPMSQSSDDGTRVSEREIRRKVRILLSYQLDVPIESLRDSTRFVDDLRI